MGPQTENIVNYRKIASLSPEVIVYPSLERTCEIKQHYLDKVGIPGISGIVDGTHINIESPGGNDAEMYRNRKGGFQ